MLTLNGEGQVLNSNGAVCRLENEEEVDDSEQSQASETPKAPKGKVITCSGFGSCNTIFTFPTITSFCCIDVFIAT